MKYTKSNAGKNEVEFKISITAEEWEHAQEHAYKEKKSSFNVEGFRKGKAPRKVIEKIYGKGVFFDEALNHCFYHAYSEIASKEKDFAPVDEPRIEVKKVGDDGVELIAKVTVAPEVKLGQYVGLNVKRKEAKVTEKQLKDEPERARESQARFVEVTDRPVKDGDIVNIDFSGSVNGKVFDGGTANGYDLTIGSHSFIDNFEEQLIGLNTGDSKDVHVTFPENYGEPTLAGKPATFVVKVNVIKEKQLPELNDEFASNVSDCETLDAYKAELKEHLLEHEKQRVQAELENDVIEAVIKNTEIDVPKVMVEHELDHIMQDISYRLMYQGISLEDYAKYMNTTVEEIRKSRHADAVKGVKISLVMQEIIRAEKIDVTAKDVNARLQEMAKRDNKTVEDVKSTLSDKHMAQIKNDILLHKLLDFLVEKNAI